MIIVVGGSARDAGKTTTICEIIAATPEAQWTAIKLTPHVHDLDPHGDTERFAVAGAARSFLTDTYVPDNHGRNIIVESNSIMDTLEPDLFIFVDGGGEWKLSAQRHAAKAHYVVRGHVTPELIAKIRRELTAGQ